MIVKTNPLIQSDEIEMEYLFQPPKRYTFEMSKVKRWTECHCVGSVLNLFAGKVRLKANETRVDINPDMPADYHCDARSFIVNWKGDQFDTVVFDPPYNLRKAREKYGNVVLGSITKIKNILSSVLKCGGKIISFGYDSTGMGACRGFKKMACCIINHGGDHNDTIGLVEEYVNPDAFIKYAERVENSIADTTEQNGQEYFGPNGEIKYQEIAGFMEKAVKDNMWNPKTYSVYKDVIQKRILAPKGQKTTLVKLGKKHNISHVALREYEMRLIKMLKKEYPDINLDRIQIPYYGEILKGRKNRNAFKAYLLHKRNGGAGRKYSGVTQEVIEALSIGKKIQIIAKNMGVKTNTVTKIKNRYFDTLLENWWETRRNEFPI